MSAAIRLLRATRIRWGLSVLGVLLGLEAPVTSDAAQQFSADLLGTTVGSGAVQTTGKIYVSNSKVRIETSGFPGGVFLLDSSAHTAFFMKPALRVVMDAKQSTWLTQILVPVDPDDPCAQWQVMAAIAGATEGGGAWRCNRLVPDSGGRRDAVGFLAISPQGFRYNCWIDPGLKFAISVREEKGGTFDLKNIQETPVPDRFFEIPANFSKFEPQQLINRVKQSDVWVEPPK